jgi:hypothetical protein
VPILFSTGAPELLGDLAEKPDIFVLKKPVNNDKLLTEVRRMLKI